MAVDFKKFHDYNCIESIIRINLNVVGIEEFLLENSEKDHTGKADFLLFQFYQVKKIRFIHKTFRKSSRKNLDYSIELRRYYVSYRNLIPINKIVDCYNKIPEMSEENIHSREALAYFYARSGKLLLAYSVYMDLISKTSKWDQY